MQSSAGWLAIFCLLAGTISTPAAQQQCFLDLSFVVDSSGSINYKDPRNWDTTLQFVANITNNFTIGPNDVQVAFVVFGTTAEVEWGLTRYQDKTSLINAIMNVPYLDDLHTNLNDALYLTRTEVYAPGQRIRPNAARATIILTDGEDNRPEVGTPLTTANATALKNDGVRLIGVGVSSQVDEDRMLQIVSSPDDLYHVDDFDALSSLVAKITQQICPATPVPPTGADMVTTEVHTTLTNIIQENGSIDTGQMVAIIIGVFVVGCVSCLIVVIIVICVRRRKKAGRNQPPQQTTDNESSMNMYFSSVTGSDELGGNAGYETLQKSSPPAGEPQSVYDEIKNNDYLDLVYDVEAKPPSSKAAVPSAYRK